MPGTRTFRSSSAEPEHLPCHGSTRTCHATLAASSWYPGAASALSGPRGRQGGRTRHLVMSPWSCSCAIGAAQRAGLVALAASLWSQELQLRCRGRAEGKVAALTSWLCCLGAAVAPSGLRGGQQGGRTHRLKVLTEWRTCDSDSSSRKQAEWIIHMDLDIWPSGWIGLDFFAIDVGLDWTWLSNIWIFIGFLLFGYGL